MLSRRLALRRSKRFRISKEQPDYRAPVYCPVTAAYTGYSNAPTIVTDIWMFLLDYYGSLLAIFLELLILTITGILQHTLFLVRLCS